MHVLLHPGGGIDPSSRPFRIYICGSYRDREGDGRTVRQLLIDLESALCAMGFDAYTQLSPRSTQLVGDLRPAEKTRRLDAVSDLTVFVGTTAGREGGWVAELVDLNRTDPRGAGRRALLLESSFPLTQVLDAAAEGLLADPYIVAIDWADAKELLDLVVRLAAAVSLRGMVPRAAPAGRVRAGDLDWG
jgi:hypothetical protein